MKLFTIGFTKKSADTFFTKLKQSGAKQVLDVRLNNASQLAGFTKRNDLKFFLREICHMGYIHMPELAPTKDILDEYKKNKGDWAVYEQNFLELMRKREIEKKIDRDVIEDSCLLCSEDNPKHCHRRLVAEYMNLYLGDIEIVHIV
ncbi:MAG: DUF488 domain-containing protein [Planctomycetes bacterium]|nr:DUF488 domain-containing protein [Planctomycetota bacterium]